MYKGLLHSFYLKTYQQCKGISEQTTVKWRADNEMVDLITSGIETKAIHV